MSLSFFFGSHPTNRSFLRVAVIVERTVQRDVEAKSGRIGVKARDLAPKYVTPDKVPSYIKKLREKGLWSWDEDWPNDEEDHGPKELVHITNRLEVTTNELRGNLK